jgi:hypothetical protein
MTAPFPPDDAEAKATVQEAIEVFLSANSPDEMAEVVATYPFVAEAHFNEILEQMIEHASRAGQPEAMFHLQEQIAILEEVLREDAATPVERTVEDFLYAEDEEEARSIFAANAALLRTDEAAKLLFSLEASDPESHLHLETRRQLWQHLAGATG